MAKGKDERHNPNRKVSRPMSVEDEIARAFMTDEELADFESEWAIDEDSSNTIRKADEASRKTPTQTRYLHDKDY